MKKVERTLSIIYFTIKHLKVPIIIALTLLIITVPMFINPLRRPQGILKNYILQLTPIGTNIEDVIEIIEMRRTWEILNINFDSGYLHPGPQIPGWPTAQSGASIIGEQSISIFGNYRAFYYLFLNKTVYIFWGFDADGKLIKVYVDKFIEI